MSNNATPCKSGRLRTIPPRGLEQDSNSLEKEAISEQSGAESGAYFANLTQIDPNLTQLIDAWQDISEPVKAGILAMVRLPGSATGASGA